MKNHKKVKAKSTGTGERKVKEYSSGTVSQGSNVANSKTIHTKYGLTGDGFKPKAAESKTAKPEKRKTEAPKSIKKK